LDRDRTGLDKTAIMKGTIMDIEHKLPTIGNRTVSKTDEKRGLLQALSHLWERHAQMLEKTGDIGTCPMLLDKVQASYLRSAEYTKSLIDSLELNH
jgi:hypothetical protein